MFANRQPEAGAAILAGCGRICLLKFLKNASHGFCADADTAVDYIHGQFFPIAASAYCNCSRAGKFG